MGVVSGLAARTQRESESVQSDDLLDAAAVAAAAAAQSVACPGRLL